MTALRSRQRTKLDPGDLAFLAETSRRLVQASEEALLDTVVHLAVPRLGDWCVIDVQGHGGPLGSCAAWHANPKRRAELPAELRQALTEEMAKEAEPLLLGSGREERGAELLRQLGVVSYLAIPLMIRERRLGMVHFGIESPGRTFERRNLLLAREFVLHLALPFENAFLRAQLAEALGKKEEFLKAICHDLRTPLAVMQLHLGELERRGAAGLDVRMRSRLEAMDQQLVEITALVDRWQDTDAGQGPETEFELRPEPVDLAALATEVGHRMRQQLAWAHCPLTMHAPPSVVGRWDRARLYQILACLLSNARKYGAGQPIELVVEDQGETVLLVVRDRGVGVAPEDHERIFDKFARVCSGGGLSGTGIGLWFARRVIGAQGGSISIDSALGQGATFTVVLPKRHPSPAPVSSPSSSLSPSAPSNGVPRARPIS
jgi:signal transduction histidine kinase